MTAPLGSVERLGNGNVALTIGSSAIEMTPDHVDALVRSLLRKAHPKEHMFVIPVAAGPGGADPKESTDG